MRGGKISSSAKCVGRGMGPKTPSEPMVWLVGGPKELKNLFSRRLSPTRRRGMWKSGLGSRLGREESP